MMIVWGRNPPLFFKEKIMIDFSLQINQMLIEHEGFEHKVYTCSAGKPTIGVGRNLEDKGLSTDEIYYLLENDINYFELELKEKLCWFKNLTINRQDVLVDMAFNLGISGLLKFKNTLRLIEEGNYELAAKEMLKSKWATQVKNRAKHLSIMMAKDCSFEKAKELI
jgi:lysozyme